jgi:hypothetical protein
MKHAQGLTGGTPALGKMQPAMMRLTVAHDDFATDTHTDIAFLRHQQLLALERQGDMSDIY